MKVNNAFWFSIIAFLFFALPGLSQNSLTPQGISYQAIARDVRGIELANTDIGVRISLIRNSLDGSVEWIEQHSVTTDRFGLFNLIIGEGTREAGSLVSQFSDIPWGEDRYFLKVEIDFGFGYRNLGIMPLLSVPYALHATYADSSGNGGKDNQTLSYNASNYKLFMERGGSVDLSGLRTLISKIDLKEDTLSIFQGDQVQRVKLNRNNQQLSLLGNILTLSNDTSSVNLTKYDKYLSLRGNALILTNTPNPLVDLSQYQYYLERDTDINSYVLKDGLSRTKGNIYLAPYIQDLRFNNDRLWITGNKDSTIVDLRKYLQKITVDTVSNKLYITNGNGVSSINIDASPSNEIQSLVLNDSILSLTKDPAKKTINLNSFDNQKLHVNAPNSLTIDNGNTVLIDTDPTNELQNLSWDGRQLSISQGNSVTINPSIGFRFRKTNTTSVPSMDTITIVFDFQDDYNDGYGYNAGTGVFTAPQAGFYSFYLNYISSEDGQKIYIFKNDKYYETLVKNTNIGVLYSLTFIVKLSSGDSMKIRLYTSGGITCGTGSLTGVKVQ